MPSDRETILLKIRKLLAVGQSTGSQAESENAMAHAERLMRKYNIALAQVEEAEIDPGDWREVQVFAGRRHPWEQPFVLDIVNTFFFCRVITSGRVCMQTGERTQSVQLFGDAHNVEIGRYVFVFLSRTFRQLWADARKARGLSRRDARPFYAGLRDGLACRLHRERYLAAQPQADNALIVVGDRLKRALAQRYGKLNDKPVTTVRGGENAYHHGRRQGEAIALRDAIKQSSRKTARIGN